MSEKDRVTKEIKQLYTRKFKEFDLEECEILFDEIEEIVRNDKIEDVPVCLEKLNQIHDKQQGDSLFKKFLSMAIEWGQIEIVKYLLKKNPAIINQTINNRKQTPLMLAVTSGHDDITELLSFRQAYRIPRIMLSYEDNNRQLSNDIMEGFCNGENWTVVESFLLEDYYSKAKPKTQNQFLPYTSGMQRMHAIQSWDIADVKNKTIILPGSVEKSISAHMSLVYPLQHCFDYFGLPQSKVYKLMTSSIHTEDDQAAVTRCFHKEYAFGLHYKTNDDALKNTLMELCKNDKVISIGLSYLIEDSHDKGVVASDVSHVMLIYVKEGNFLIFNNNEHLFQKQLDSLGALAEYIIAATPISKKHRDKVHSYTASFVVTRWDYQNSQQQSSYIDKEVLLNRVDTGASRHVLFLLAAEIGDIAAMRYILQKNMEHASSLANTTSSTELLIIPLHYAAMHGDLEMILLLINAGADLESTDNCRRTPLMFAAAAGQGPAVALLIAGGANVGAYDGLRTAQGHLLRRSDINNHTLALTANTRYYPAAKAFADHCKTSGIREMLSTSGPQQHPIEWAIANGQVALMKYLIKMLITASSYDKRYEQLLYASFHFAIVKNQQQIVADILGLVKEAQDSPITLKSLLSDKGKYSCAPINLAGAFGRKEIAMLLFKAGAEPSINPETIASITVDDSKIRVNHDMVNIDNVLDYNVFSEFKHSSLSNAQISSLLQEDEDEVEDEDDCELVIEENLMVADVKRFVTATRKDVVYDPVNPSFDRFVEEQKEKKTKRVEKAREEPETNLENPVERPITKPGQKADTSVTVKALLDRQERGESLEYLGHPRAAVPANTGSPEPNIVNVYPPPS